MTQPATLSSISDVIGTPVSSSPWSVPQVWDSVVVSGVTYGPVDPTGPGGKVRVRHAGRKYKIDKKDGQGQDGYTTTYRGIKPRVFAIEFYMWTTAQYDYYTQTVFPVLLVNGLANTVQAIAIQYPTLAQIGILSVFVESIDAIEEITDDRDKMYRQTVMVSEYLPPPPKNTTTTPIGSKTTEPLPDGVQPTLKHQLAVLNENNAKAALQQLENE